jgi:hypothetical protein
MHKILTFALESIYSSKQDRALHDEKLLNKENMILSNGYFVTI